MISIRSIGAMICLSVLLTPLMHAQDLAAYQNFRFGMSLILTAKQTGMQPSEAKLLHQRPALIQELWWTGSLGRSLPRPDLVRNIVFSFYNDKLFRIVITYDQNRTEGLTDDDMIEAISADYGASTCPIATIVTFSSSEVYNDSEKVLARWEDAGSSFNLFRDLYRPAFGMVAFSKPLDSLAQAAIMEALRLDQKESIQRDLERHRKENWARRKIREKAKPVNKTIDSP